ncbi:MAG: hypothetical protein RQ856_06425 [Candidatus Izemoplasmatales bacterium]|nr:hypothetical protein [Candidatus Izemoplasmatales bacterium]
MKTNPIILVILILMTSLPAQANSKKENPKTELKIEIKGQNYYSVNGQNFNSIKEVIREVRLFRLRNSDKY